MTQDRWLSMRELSKYLGVSNDSIAIWIRDKNFPAVKDGYYWIVVTISTSMLMVQQTLLVVSTVQPTMLRRS